MGLVFVIHQEGRRPVSAPNKACSGLGGGTLRFLGLIQAKAFFRFTGWFSRPTANARCGLTQHILHAKSSEIVKFSSIFDDSSLQRM